MKSAREMVVEAIHKWYHSDKCHCCTDLADQILSALGQGECDGKEKEPRKDSLCETCKIVKGCNVRFSTMGITNKCGLYQPLGISGKENQIKETPKRIDHIGCETGYITMKFIDKMNEMIDAINEIKVLNGEGG